MLLDRLLDRHVALADIAAGIGMATHEQHQEDHHGEAEIVVALAAHDSGQRLVLQFRRREGRHADIARMNALAVADLEAVAIDQPHPRVLRDQDAAMVHVGDRVALGVQGGEGARDIGRDPDQEAPVGAGNAARRLFGL